MTAIKCSRCGVTANSKTLLPATSSWTTSTKRPQCWIFKRRLETDSNGQVAPPGHQCHRGPLAPAEQPETKGWVEDELSRPR